MFHFIDALLLLLLLLFFMINSVRTHASKSLWLMLSRYDVLGTYGNMSPESSSSLVADRPIRPLPKRRLRERLSPDVAQSIKYPPAPQSTTPLFIYPYPSRDESAPSSTDLLGAINRDNGLKSTVDAGFRRNGLVGGHDDLMMNQTRRVMGSRGFPESGEHAVRVAQRSGLQRQPKPPQPPPSTASSADGYDSFENTNNKKKRKIPIAGEMILNGTHVLNEPASFGIPSPPTTGDEDGGDMVPTSTPYYSGGPLSNAQGISGPGRGRYGRIRNGRSPLRALSDSNANWTGRNMKLRSAGQYPSPPAGKCEFCVFFLVHSVFYSFHLASSPCAPRCLFYKCSTLYNPVTCTTIKLPSESKQHAYPTA